MRRRTLQRCPRTHTTAPLRLCRLIFPSPPLLWLSATLLPWPDRSHVDIRRREVLLLQPPSACCCLLPADMVTHRYASLTHFLLFRVHLGPCGGTSMAQSQSCCYASSHSTAPAAAQAPLPAPPRRRHQQPILVYRPHFFSPKLVWIPATLLPWPDCRHRATGPVAAAQHSLLQQLRQSSQLGVRPRRK